MRDINPVALTAASAAALRYCRTRAPL